MSPHFPSRRKAYCARAFALPSACPHLNEQGTIGQEPIARTEAEKRFWGGAFESGGILGLTTAAATCNSI
jgi:hypothetical protein